MTTQITARDLVGTALVNLKAGDYAQAMEDLGMLDGLPVGDAVQAQARKIVATLASYEESPSIGVKRFIGKLRNELESMRIPHVVIETDVAEEDADDVLPTVENAPKAKKADAPKKEKKEAPPAPFCLCGCGEKTSSHKRVFVQGHDQRMKGAIMRAAKENDGVVLASLFPACPLPVLVGLVERWGLGEKGVISVR